MKKILRKILYSIVAVGLLFTSAQASTLTIVEIEEGISIFEDIPDVMGSVEEHKAAGQMFPLPNGSYVECAKILEVEETFLCIFNYGVFMNLALNRAAAYIEENAGVLSHLDHINNPLNRQAEGQDLTGPDLREFWGAFGEEKQTFLKPDLDFEIQQLQIEEDFWNNFLLNKLEESPNLVILAIALDSDVNAVLSHEVLHAQYFKNEVFQDVVSDFWKDNVLLEDKKAIKRKLSPYYDVDNEELLINEFQAYILMNNAENNELGFLVPKYREGLMAELLENDIEPIQLSIVLEENND